MSRHGLVKVNDKEGPCVVEGQFLIPEDSWIMDHDLPWNYAVNKVFQPVCSLRSA